jgi:hypothetical protein
MKRWARLSGARDEPDADVVSARDVLSIVGHERG